MSWWGLEGVWYDTVLIAAGVGLTLVLIQLERIRRSINGRSEQD